MPRIPADKCCGCTACFAACPCAAIEMKADSEGFMYPVVDGDKCIGCGRCEKVCPVITPPEVSGGIIDCVIAQHMDGKVLSESTSGGFLDALCKHITNNMGGYAAGVAFNEDFMPVHRIADNYADARAFRNSKYAQSDMGNVFAQVRGILDNGGTVLFIGTPCQTAGLSNFIGNDRDNLYIADLVCRSVPSPEFWRSYLDWQKKRNDSGILSVRCRSKTYGYHSGALEIGFANGKRYAGSNRVDYFMKSFHGDICSRPSCYDCPFKTLERVSDFTVFDSWSPQAASLEPFNDNDRGYSNVLIRTEKGRRILETMTDVRVFRADADRLMAFTGGMERRSVERKPARDSFFADLNRMSFEKTVRKYVRVTLFDRVIEAMKPARYYIKKKLRRR